MWSPRRDHTINVRMLISKGIICQKSALFAFVSALSPLQAIKHHPKPPSTPGSAAACFCCRWDGDGNDADDAGGGTSKQCNDVNDDNDDDVDDLPRGMIGPGDGTDSAIAGPRDECISEGGGRRGECSRKHWGRSWQLQRHQSAKEKEATQPPLQKHQMIQTRSARLRMHGMQKRKRRRPPLDLRLSLETDVEGM